MQSRQKQRCHQMPPVPSFCNDVPTNVTAWHVAPDKEKATHAIPAMTNSLHLPCKTHFSDPCTCSKFLTTNNQSTATHPQTQSHDSITSATKKCHPSQCHVNNMLRLPHETWPCVTAQKHMLQNGPTERNWRNHTQASNDGRWRRTRHPPPANMAQPQTPTHKQERFATNWGSTKKGVDPFSVPQLLSFTFLGVISSVWKQPCFKEKDMFLFEKILYQVPRCLISHTVSLSQADVRLGKVDR